MLDAPARSGPELAVTGKVNDSYSSLFNAFFEKSLYRFAFSFDPHRSVILNQQVVASSCARLSSSEMRGY